MRPLHVLALSFLLPAVAAGQTADLAAAEEARSHGGPRLELGLGTFLGAGDLQGGADYGVGITVDLTLRHRVGAVSLQRDWGRVQASRPLDDWSFRFDFGPEAWPVSGFAGFGVGDGQTAGGTDYDSRFWLAGVRLASWRGLSVRGEVRVREDHWLAMPSLWGNYSGIVFPGAIQREKGRELRLAVQWQGLWMRTPRRLANRAGAGRDCSINHTGVSSGCFPAIELAVAPFLGHSVLTSDPLVSFGLQAEVVVHWEGWGAAFQYEGAGLYNAAAMDFDAVSPWAGSPFGRPSKESLFEPDRREYAVRIEGPFPAPWLTGFVGAGAGTGVVAPGPPFKAEFALAGLRYPMTAGTSLVGEVRMRRHRIGSSGVYAARPGTIGGPDESYDFSGVELRFGLRWAFRLVYDP